MPLVMSFSKLDLSPGEVPADTSKMHQEFGASPSRCMKGFGVQIMRHFSPSSNHQSFQCCVNPFAFSGVAVDLSGNIT